VTTSLEHAAFPAVSGAHLVGSINQPSADATFRAVGPHLGAHLARIPDGEIGERFHWILFQGGVFARTEGLARIPIDPIVVAGFDVRPFALDGTVEAKRLELPALGYAANAISSYIDFARLRADGVVPAGTRFQVCLPTPLAPVTTFIAPADRAAVYPLYRDALLREIEQMLSVIPAGDLAIQLDMATEFAYLEGVSLGGGALEPFFSEGSTAGSKDAAAKGDATSGAADGPSVHELTADVVRLAGEIAARMPKAVELGFHLCYGDVAERHFVEPEDAGLLAAVASGLTRTVARPISWIHMPVPIERDDEGYSAPLAHLELSPATHLFLGVVHHEDGVDGALRRLAPARAALARAGVERVGVGTECGFGRGPAERTVPLLDLHADVIEAAARA